MDEPAITRFEGQDNFLHTVAEVNGVKTSQNNPRILHLNIRSISKNYKELDVLLETFDKKPDLVICTETWEFVNTGFFSLKNFYLK